MIETDPAQNPGKALAEKREQLGLTLQDVAGQTRIRKVYLESIEAGQLQNLPGQAYATGFMRVYARHLGLDSDELLSRLEASQETEAAHLSNLKPADNLRVQSESQPRQGGGWGAFFVGFLVVLALGALFYFMPVAFDSTTPAKLSSKEATNLRQTTPSQQDAMHDAVKSFAASAPVMNPDSEPVDDELSSGHSLPVVAKDGSNLGLLALTDSSLIIYIDDQEPREYAMHNGLELSWNIKNSVRVELAAAGIARFWLDGQELNLAELKIFQLSTDPGD